MAYNRGEVVLVLFPDSNFRTVKRRPALIFQSDQLQTGLPQTIVAMITSNLHRAGPPSRILVQMGSPVGQQAGLLTDSVIVADNLATVLNSEIDRAIGRIDDMTDINGALRATLGL